MTIGGAFFATRAPLVAADRDECNTTDYPYEGPGCRDLYGWHDGITALVSTGPADDQSGCGESAEYFSDGCPLFVGASHNGSLVYFQTISSLVPGDTDGGLAGVYASGVATQQCRPKAHGAAPGKCWAGRGK